MESYYKKTTFLLKWEQTFETYYVKYVKDLSNA